MNSTTWWSEPTTVYFWNSDEPAGSSTSFSIAIRPSLRAFWRMS
jgi:hypothetical protein